MNTPSIKKNLGRTNDKCIIRLFTRGKTVIEESELGVLIDNQLFESALAIPNVH